MRWRTVVLMTSVLIAGCGREPGSKTVTKGSLTIECDEAVAPVMRLEAEEFGRQYKESQIAMRSVEAREAIADLVNDSVQVIVCGRALNREEREAVATAKIRLQEYYVALGAVCIIAHADAPIDHLRMSELDSIFAGRITSWPGSRKRRIIDLVVGGVNSSTNEVFRSRVLKEKPFALSATPMSSSGKLVEYVGKTAGALGLVGVNWIKGGENAVKTVSLGTPGYSPDSTQAPGEYYAPAQAYVYKGYYPITSPVYIYSRDVNPDVSVGFISFVSSAPGQKIVLNNGLVPVTMPVRLVQLTSEQVKTQ
jgi:phosphate transport system substrate-binding protein